MSPLQIQILLHYHCGATDFRDGDFSAQAVESAINEFFSQGILMDNHSMEKDAPNCVITERGRVFVEYICSLPLPVQKWEVPR